MVKFKRSQILVVFKNFTGFMRKYIIAFGGSILPFLALANGEHGEEGSAFADQMNELLPMVHFGEAHYVAAIVSIILWLSLIYTVYSLVRTIFID